MCYLSLTGTVDIGHLPHPVLMHLRTFFDLWDSFTLQAVQSGQPYISDHIMFEVRTHSLCHFASTVYNYNFYCYNYCAATNTTATSSITSTATIFTAPASC